jgi:hypothetical protein
MADENKESGSNGDEDIVAEEATNGEGGEPAEADVKRPKTFSRRANQNLRQARRSIEGGDWQPDERAKYLIAEANVLATLDLADAIRSGQGAATPSGK